MKRIFILTSTIIFGACSTLPASPSVKATIEQNVDKLSDSAQYNQSVTDAHQVEAWEVSKKIGSS